MRPRSEILLESEKEFSGFEERDVRRESISSYSDIPNLEWDGSSLIMDNYEPKRMSSRNFFIVLEPEMLDENLSEREEKSSRNERWPIIVEESSNEPEEEIIRSHSMLIRFLE